MGLGWGCRTSPMLDFQGTVQYRYTVPVRVSRLRPCVFLPPPNCSHAKNTRQPKRLGPRGGCRGVHRGARRAEIAPPNQIELETDGTPALGLGPLIFGCPEGSSARFFLLHASVKFSKSDLSLTTPERCVPRAARFAARDRARGMGSPFGIVVGECRSDPGRALAAPPEEAADALQGRLRARRVPEAVPPARVTCVVLVVYSESDTGSR